MKRIYDLTIQISNSIPVPPSEDFDWRLVSSIFRHNYLPEERVVHYWEADASIRVIPGVNTIEEKEPK